MSNWNPVVTDEKLTGLNRLRRPTAPAGEILVLLSKSGAADVLQPGTTPTAGEMMVKNYDRAVTLTANPHPVSTEFEISSRDVGVVFTIGVSLDVHVTPAYAATAARTFAAKSDSADSLISQRIEAILTPICSQYGQNDRIEAERHALSALREQLDVTTWGFVAGDIAVTLRLPADLEKAIGAKHAALHRRETEVANLDHNQRLTTQRNEFGREQKLLDTDTELEQDRRRAVARDETERLDQTRGLEFERLAALQSVDLDRERKFAELQLSSAEKEETLRLQLAALEAAKEMGQLSEAELLRMHVLQNPDAAAEILRARTQQIGNTDRQKLNVLHQLIENEEIDIRRDEDLELMERLLPGRAATGGQGEVQGIPAPPESPVEELTRAEDNAADSETVDAELVSDNEPASAEPNPFGPPPGAEGDIPSVGDAADASDSGPETVDEVSASPAVDAEPSQAAPQPGVSDSSSAAPASGSASSNPFGDEPDDVSRPGV